MSMILEASLPRVWQHFSSDRPVALLTGFRGEYTKEENLRRNAALAADIRNLGLGFFYVDGYWIENQGTPEERKVSEDSIFVIGEPNTDEKFLDAIVKFGKQYDQDGVLVKTQNTVAIYDKNGEVLYPLNKLNPGKLGTMYTKPRNNKHTNTFVFTEERVDRGWAGRFTA